jgi:hypothetical protein
LFPSLFDELKNQWGWGGFTTSDIKRCHLMAGLVALYFNWWNLFVRLADPNHHREAITSRPLPLQAIGRQTRHAGRTTVSITSSHGEHHRARKALTRIAGFFAQAATNCGAVDTPRTLVPDPQRGPQKISPRAETGPATTTSARRSCELWLRNAATALFRAANLRI